MWIKNSNLPFLEIFKFLYQKGKETRKELINLTKNNIDNDKVL